MSTTTTIQDGPHAIEAQPENATWPVTEVKTVVKVTAILVPLLSVAAHYMSLIATLVMTNNFHLFYVPMIVLGLAYAYVLPLIVMLLFQIGKRFRNSRSRWRIFLNTGLVSLGLQLLSSISEVIKLFALFVPN